MKIQARQSILDMWQATVGYAYDDDKKKWTWGGRREPNCISDAEQLLVLLYPATTITSLRLESIDETGDDVLGALSRVGRAPAIPKAVIDGARDYLTRYRDGDGEPTFAGDTYYQAPGAETEAVKRQRQLDVVDAYSMSVTLCLAVIGFAKVYRATLSRPNLQKEVADVEALASRRLSAAMVGLLRSFNVHTFEPDSDSGQAMLAMVNQNNASQQATVGALNKALDEVWTGLKQGLSEGLGEAQRQVFDDFVGTDRLFECGWSWGILDGAPRVSYAEELVPRQPDGVAEARPYMYFTVTALDGIEDLFSERTRILNLLTVDQQRLARALQNRWSLTRQFWARLATFGDTRWPLEDVPWRATDGTESDYHSLLLSAIVAQGLASERGAGPGLRRVGKLLTELAARAKITRRAVDNDPAVALHLPGMTMKLRGSEKAGDGIPIEWVVSSFSMLLLKQVVQVARLVDDSVERTDLLQLADDIWEHLQRRRLRTGSGEELWDSPENLYPGLIQPREPKPSWYHTERTMEALVQAALAVESESSAGNSLRSVAQQILAEAENLFDRELLRGGHESAGSLRAEFREVQARLRRSRELLPTRPATSSALANEALMSIDRLAAARQGASGAS